MPRPADCLRGYGLALLSLAAAGVLGSVPGLGDKGVTDALLLMLAIIVAARYGGTGPALMTVTLILIIIRPPSLEGWRVAMLLVYLVVGISLSLLIGPLADAKRKAEAHAGRLGEAERRVSALNADLNRRVAEFQALLDVIPVGIGIADDPACASIRVNGYFSRILGLAEGANASLSAPEGDRPTHFRVLRGGQEVAAADLPIQRAAAAGVEVRDEELEVVHDDGRVITLLESASPLFDEAGRVRGSVGAVVDVTESRRAREELTRSKESAESAVKAKNLFLAMLSHELRTPLTPALLSVDDLLSDPRTPARMVESLESIRRGIALEARLVDDLLDVTRAGAGKLHLTRSRLDAHEVVRQALTTCEADLRDAGLTLSLDLAADRVELEADPARLQQVIWNLVKNACKFTPRGGAVSVRSRAGPSGLVIEVEDNGSGLEPGLIERVFSPFEQGAEGLRRAGGLGLGLALARAVAEAHAGRLHARSPGPGLGSTFVLELPTAPLDEARGAAPTPDPAPDPAMATAPMNWPSPRPARGWPRRVLLVDDDASTLHALARLLRDRGSEVAVADTLDEARRALDGPRFDLIVSDLGLPDGSGLDLADRLRGPDGPPRSIALSGHGSAESVRLSLDAGFSAHLTKPVSFAALEAEIRRLAAPEPVC